MSENTTNANRTSRRRFLTDSGRIAGVSTLAGMTLPYVHAAENNTIQLALVGCGGRGTGAAENALGVKNGPDQARRHGGRLSRRSSPTATAVCGSSFASRWTFPQERKFIGFDALPQGAWIALKPGDVAILATPPAFRWVHFSYAIDKGLNVFMEKPVTRRRPHHPPHAELGEAAVQKNLKVGVGLMVRHCRARQELLEPHPRRADRRHRRDARLSHGIGRRHVAPRSPQGPPN